MAVSISGQVYPATKDDFLEFDAYTDLLDGAGAPMWDVAVLLSLSHKPDEAVVYRDGAFRGTFASLSTVTGAGTSADRMHFRVKPVRGWPEGSNVLRTRIVEQGPQVGIDNPEPVGWESRYDYRQFQDATLMQAYLDNLAANPSIRATHPHSNMTAQCMVQDTDAPRLAGLDACVTKANALSPVMEIYPGIRVMPSTSSNLTTWCSLSHWEDMASKVETLLGYRQAGDPRIALDAEAYGSAGFGGSNNEPSVTTLTAAGFTEAQFFTAMQPLVDVLLAADPLPVVLTYPHVVSATANDIASFTKRLLQTLGTKRVQILWEDTFGATETHRLSPHVSFPFLQKNVRQNEGDFERFTGFYELKHRHVVDDDIIRAWAGLFSTVENSFGGLRGWIVDETKMDRSSYGTPEGYVGTTVSTVNDIDYGWAFGGEPLLSTLVNPMSVGKQASIALPQFRGSASIQTAGLAAEPDVSGLRLVSTISNPYGALRVSAMPTGASPNGANAWTTDQTIRIPSSLAADVPLLGQAFSNLALHQVYYDAGADAIKWVHRANGVNSTPVTLLASPARDTDIRIILSRDGNDTWRWSVNGSAVATFSTGLAVTVSNSATWIMGGGQTVATFGAGNNCESCDDLICVNQFLVWWRALLTTGSPTEWTKINSGQFPINRTVDSGTP